VTLNAYHPVALLFSLILTTSREAWRKHHFADQPTSINDTDREHKRIKDHSGFVLRNPRRTYL